MPKEEEINHRKKEHIKLAFESQVLKADPRFFYEPLLMGHPRDTQKLEIEIVNKILDYPIWISSMTGGAKIAKEINKNLAKVAAKYKLGMGLGSCRVILNNNTYIADFAVRKYINNQPLFANLGIAQIGLLTTQNKIETIRELIKKTEADGLIVHINPLQEWMQPGGDRYYEAPLQTIEKLIDKLDFPIIIKEVGQGFGPKSIAALLKLPIEALDYGALGGTNFSKLEFLRHQTPRMDALADTINIGHTALEMTEIINLIKKESPKNINAKKIIVSGGIASYLDGYFHIKKLQIPAIYGQASAMLKYAQIGYEPLEEYVLGQIEGLQLAQQFLTLK